MIAHLLVIMAANRNRQGALLLAQILGVLITIWHVLCFLEKHAFPPVAQAALVGLLPTPSLPVTTAAITAVSAALVAIYAYTRPMSQTLTKCTPHPACGFTSSTTTEGSLKSS